MRYAGVSGDSPQVPEGTQWFPRSPAADGPGTRLCAQLLHEHRKGWKVAQCDEAHTVLDGAGEGAGHPSDGLWYTSTYCHGSRTAKEPLGSVAFGD